jgi:CD2 antigen cytoplasmic tail-binding protein 2
VWKPQNGGLFLGHSIWCFAHSTCHVTVAVIASPCPLYVTANVTAMSRTNQKRAATSGVESPGDVGPVFKKTRFEEPTHDPVAFSEEVDLALEDPSKRKGRVKTDGYESDSTDDGEGVVLSRRNDESDMLSAGEEQTGKKKKKQEFLRLGDIEGQEFGTRSGSESSDEGEPEDEDDAERRKKAGMGYEMSSFNMREEMEEGKFAADGTYVRSFDPHGIHDRWMEGIDEKDIKLARKRKKVHDRQQKEKMEAEALDSQRKEELEKSLLAMLKKGESVLEALQRLGARSRKLKQAAQRCVSL